MADLPTLRFRLAEAELALHKLTVGKLIVEIDVEGKGGSKYTAANRADLEAYVGDLKRQVAALEGTPVRRGPFQMGF